MFTSVHSGKQKSSLDTTFSLSQCFAVLPLSRILFEFRNFRLLIVLLFVLSEKSSALQSVKTATLWHVAGRATFQAKGPFVAPQFSFLMKYK